MNDVHMVDICRQGNAVEVMAENVIIASISVNDEGELEILVYVQVANEVLEGKYLLLALEVRFLLNYNRLSL